MAVAALQLLQQRSVDGAGPVFVTIDGEPLQGYRHWFDAAVNEAGIKDFTWYCLRHTFASRLVMTGVDIRTVAELMGHQQIQMTMHYAHLAPAHTLAAVERLVGQARQPAKGQTPTKALSATPSATSTKEAALAAQASFT